MEELGVSCFVMTQYGAGSDKDKLKTCFTMENGGFVLLGRFVNGEKVK